jgi:hypothetical protein
MTFPAHQGLILPAARRWPNSIDALALSVGAAMPDITDTVLGFSINGYFKQWYGHSLVGIFTLDLLGGLFIAWLIAVFAGWFPQFTYRLPHPGVWVRSMLIGILSHIGFDLISHDTNLLFYPWHKNTRWFPEWWYKTWFEFRPLPMFGRSYSVGIFSIIWGLLTVLGIFLFIRFLRQTKVPVK